MTPMTSLFTEQDDLLRILLIEEHRLRYEKIRAYRQEQKNPNFTEVPNDWHTVFSEEE